MEPNTFSKSMYKMYHHYKHSPCTPEAQSPYSYPAVYLYLILVFPYVSSNDDIRIAACCLASYFWVITCISMQATAPYQLCDDFYE